MMSMDFGDVDGFENVDGLKMSMDFSSILSVGYKARKSELS